MLCGVTALDPALASNERLAVHRTLRFCAITPVPFNGGAVVICIVVVPPTQVDNKTDT